MTYQSTKTWGTERGLSCAFRQWRANSHCNLLHGYSLSIKLVFQSEQLDTRNWVVDFGGFKALKDRFDALFDHKTLVARDDPEWSLFVDMEQANIIELVPVDHVGCEAFAKLVYDTTIEWMDDNGIDETVHLVSAEVAEHGSNSAVYIG